MKKYKKSIRNTLFLLLLLSFSSTSFGQNVSEKLLVKFPDAEIPNSYYVKYDKNTGAYAYSKIDTINEGAWLVTPGGESPEYYGISIVNTFFDKSGNVYCAAYNYSKVDSSTTYFLLKNSKPIAAFQGLTDNWVEKNGTLYFKVNENHNEYFAMLDLSSGNITKGKAYDTIIFMYYPPQTEAEGDPPPYPGFTPDGKYYYCAILDGKRFMVIGGAEQKAYTDIDGYNTAFDNNGNFVYVATDEGSLSNYDNPVKSFVVQGDNEYSKFNSIYGPFAFLKDNKPYYIGVQKMSASLSIQKVMAGSTEMSKGYSGGVSDIQLTSSGKLAFVGTNYNSTNNTESYIVIDGKEYGKYENVYSLSFDGDTPVFIEKKGDKQFVVKGHEKISDSYQNITYYKFFKDGNLYYIGCNLGDNTSDKTDRNYIYIGDKKLGPFVSITNGHEADDPYIIADSTGAYIFSATKLTDKKSNTYKEIIYSAKGNSGMFDQVDNIGLCNGKAVFVGYQFGENEQYPVEGRLNINGKGVGKNYLNISNFEMNPGTGTISFIGVRNGSAYYVEAKL